MKTIIIAVAVLLAACGRPDPLAETTYVTVEADAGVLAPDTGTGILVPSPDAGAQQCPVPDAGTPVPSAFAQCYPQVQDICVYSDPADGGDGICRGSSTGVICGANRDDNGANCYVAENQKWINWACEGSPFTKVGPGRCIVPADPYCLIHGTGPGLLPGSYCLDIDSDGLPDMVFGYTTCTR